MSARPDLPALISSRICHDLISPIGAISNGIELIGALGEQSGPEMALISESVASAMAKVRFFRIAFGAAAADSRLEAREITGCIKDMFQGRFQVDAAALNTPMPRAAVRVIYLTLLCLEKSCPIGGKATITPGTDGIGLTLTGEKLRLDTELWSLAQPPGSDGSVEAAQVQFPLLARALDALGATLTIAGDETEIKAVLGALALTPQPA